MIGRALLTRSTSAFGRWQGFLNLFKLCFAKAGNVTDELNEPVLQHCLTSLVPSRLLPGHGLINVNGRAPQVAFSLALAQTCGGPAGHPFFGRALTVSVLNIRAMDSILPHQVRQRCDDTPLATGSVANVAAPTRVLDPDRKLRRNDVRSRAISALPHSRAAARKWRLRLFPPPARPSCRG